MRDSEEAIELVLAGLRDAEAAPGMERRILEAVEARVSKRPVANLRWAWGAAMAGMIAISLLIAITAIQKHERIPTQAQQRALPTAPFAGAQHALALPQGPIAPAITPARIVAHARKAPPISAEDALLLSEMHAHSHPAPEAPLTQEEKLLLRAIHTGDPQVMAMLNPAVRDRQEAESEAEFSRFVDPSNKEEVE